MMFFFYERKRKQGIKEGYGRSQDLYYISPNESSSSLAAIIFFSENDNLLYKPSNRSQLWSQAAISFS